MEFMDNPPIYENYGNYKTAGGQGWLAMARAACWQSSIA